MKLNQIEILPKSYRSPTWVAILGIFLSCLGYIISHEWKENLAEKRFTETCRTYAASLQRNIDQHLGQLSNIKRLYEASDSLRRDDFKAFVQDDISHNKSTIKLEWLPRIPSVLKESFEEGIRRFEYPGFQISQISSEGKIVPIEVRDNYYPIYYSEPENNGKGYLGIDPTTPEIRSTFVINSRSKNGPLVANQLSADNQSNRIIYETYLPIYTPLDTDEKTPDYSLAGLVRGLFNLGEIINSSANQLTSQTIGIETYLYDFSSKTPVLLYSKNGESDHKNPQAMKYDLLTGTYFTKRLRFADQSLEIVMEPSDVRLFIQSAHLLPWFILFTGLAITLTLFTYLIIVIRRSEHARMIAEASLIFEQNEQSSGDNSQNFNDGLWATDSSGLTTFVNSYMADLLGYSVDELIGRNILEFLDNRGRRLSKHNIIKHRRGIHEDYELNLLRKDGAKVCVKVSTAPFFDDNGDYDGSLATITDLTDTRKTDKQLLINEAKFRAITEHSSDITTIIDKNGKITYLSPSIESALGYQVNDMLGHNIRELLHLDDHQKILEAVNEAAPQKGIRLSLPEFRALDKDGQTHFFNGIITSMIDIEGVDGIVINGRNITNKKHSGQLKSTHNRVLEQLSEGSSLEEALSELLISVEQVFPGSITSIHLVDKERRTLQRSIAPTLAANFREGMNGVKIAPGNGCSAHAAYKKERIICEDVTLMPYTNNIKQRAALAGLRACWAEPIFSTRNEVIGVVAIYHSYPKKPDENQLELLQSIGQYAGIAIERHLTEEALRESEIKWRALIAHMPDYVALLDLDGTILFANRVANAYNLEEVIGTNLLEYIDPGHREAFKNTMKTVLDSGRPQTYEIPLNTPVGQIWWSNRIGLMRRAGRVTGFITIGSDITERKNIETSLNKLSSAVEQSGSAVIITDKKGTIEYVNPRFTEITGFEPSEVAGKTPAILRSEETPPSLYRQMWKSILDGDIWYGEIHNKRKNGELFWALETISPIQNESGSITHFVAVCEDLTQLKETQNEMERLTFYDSLTGLENRRLFKDRLEQAVKTTHKEDVSTALLYLDLDQFKRINDTLGHDAGDLLLKTVSKRLKDSVKSSDTVARLGGDEFAILLTEIKGSSETSLISRRLLAALSEPISLMDQDILITTSIGITLAPDDTDDPNVLMKNADLAMYRAKELGRNNYQFFTEEMNVEALGRLFLENELRQAIEQGQFILNFQPLLDLATNTTKGCEALIRWAHPERGIIPPEHFIHVAEETGQIVAVGTWVICKACEQAKVLQESGNEMTMAINLSARQFTDPQLPEIIKSALEESALNPRLLELEITESMLMDNIDLTIETLHRLKSFGVSVSIDDFGTGYSSLSYLKRLPIDTVKVDKSFVMDIPENENDMEITAAVIAMAHKLKLKVTAEGVETKEQLEFLRSNGCDHIQGYYYSRPVSAEKLMTKLPITLE